jgi:hypothetical protein
MIEAAKSVSVLKESMMHSGVESKIYSDLTKMVNELLS